MQESYRQRHCEDTQPLRPGRKVFIQLTVFLDIASGKVRNLLPAFLIFRIYWSIPSEDFFHIAAFTDPDKGSRKIEVKKISHIREPHIRPGFPECVDEGLFFYKGTIGVITETFPGDTKTISTLNYFLQPQQRAHSVQRISGCNNQIRLIYHR